MFKADIVLINGKALTMNPSQPNAQAIAIKGDKIVEVGTNTQVKRLIDKNTRVIDLKQRTVVPGFIDTHIHVAGFGRFLTELNLTGVKSIKEMQKQLKKRVKETPRGKWILGRGWDQDRLMEKRYPNRWDIDKASPENPVFLYRVCGHICVVNSKALELASITKDTVFPVGGQIDKHPKTHEPTGILRENAVDLVWKTVPSPSEQELIEAVGLACEKAVEAGLTSVHWIVQSPAEIRVVQRLRAKGNLPLRVYFLIPTHLLDAITGLGLSTGFGDSMVRIGGIKVFVDGSLGARTAALNDSYSDEPSTKGMALYSQEDLNRLVARVHKANLQLAIHAIGDKAIEMALTALERALEEAPKNDHRHRIEHASVLNERLIQRMRRLSVIASVQPHFIISDFWVINRVGPSRARWVYPFKTLIREGVLVAGGSDCPVEPISPLLGIYAAVGRESFPEERVTVDEALRFYTINAAYASFEEDVKGSIEVGKLADLTVLSHDPHVIPLREIKNVKVEMTIVGGRFVYSR